LNPSLARRVGIFCSADRLSVKDLQGGHDEETLEVLSRQFADSHQQVVKTTDDHLHALPLTGSVP
jgi:hypothetical protein